MRAEDLDNNGEADCVGLHVQDIRIITDPRISVDSLGYSPGISGKVLKIIRYDFLYFVAGPGAPPGILITGACLSKLV